MDDQFEERHRTVGELKAFIQNMPDDLLVNVYEGEVSGIRFDANEPGDEVAWFATTGEIRDQSYKG